MKEFPVNQTALESALKYLNKQGYIVIETKTQPIPHGNTIDIVYHDHIYDCVVGVCVSYGDFPPSHAILNNAQERFFGETRRLTHAYCKNAGWKGVYRADIIHVYRNGAIDHITSNRRKMTDNY